MLRSSPSSSRGLTGLSQTPASQLLAVQGLPSSHSPSGATPSLAGRNRHPLPASGESAVGSQESNVQGLPSSQSTPSPGSHFPFSGLQASVPLHEKPSSQPASHNLPQPSSSQGSLPWQVALQGWSAVSSSGATSRASSSPASPESSATSVMSEAASEFAASPSSLRRSRPSSVALPSLMRPVPSALFPSEIPSGPATRKLL